MYKAVIFDLNGVILESQFLSDRFESKYGIPTQDFFPVLKDIMKVVRKPKAPAVFSLWEPYLKKWNVKLSETELVNFWCSEENPVLGISEYIKYLHDLGVGVFILSNNFRERTEYYRHNFPEIFQYINKAYFSWETGFVKPSLEALNLLLNENKLKPADCIYFDDSQENVDLAVSLGINAKKWITLENAKNAIEG